MDALAESASGYIWNLPLNNKLYNRERRRCNARKMSCPQDYNMCTNNYYSSPALSIELIEKGFEACGSVRKGISKISKENYIIQR